MNDDIVKMFDTNELNRLQRCAKNKDKKEIMKWAQDFQHRINERYYQIYTKQFEIWLTETCKDLDTVMLYVLHFNEATKFGNKRLKSVMKDITSTMKGLGSGEFNREEYNKMLKDDGINLMEESNEQ